jgi:hypothetical protein
MKKIVIALSILILLMATTAGAFEYKLGYDFGNPFDENNNYSPIDYPFGIHNLPSPGLLGEGGEKFDLEGIHFAMEGNTVHMALANSFGLSAHSSYWHRDYALGDIFFGFNGSNTTYAIDLSSGGLYAVDLYTRIPNISGGYGGYPGISAQAGAFQMQQGRLLGSVNHEYTMWAGLEANPLQGNGDTWVMEFSFDRSLLPMSGARSVSIHNTLACGNDVMNKTFTVVPEPNSIILLGLGMLGLAAFRKRH